ncbi:MAG: hypothetical protein ACLP05_06670 [Candidatus Kryptoniota bacterium]
MHYPCCDVPNLTGEMLIALFATVQVCISMTAVRWAMEHGFFVVEITTA